MQTLVGQAVFTATSLEDNQSKIREYFGIIEGDPQFRPSSSTWLLSVRWNLPDVTPENKLAIESISPKGSTFAKDHFIGLYPAEQVVLWKMWAEHRELGRKIGGLVLGTLTMSLLTLGGSFAVQYYSRKS